MSEKQPYRPDGHCLVAQVSNLLYRRLPVGRACDLGSASALSSASAMRAASGLEIRDTADWKSALRRECIRPPDPCKVQAGAAPCSSCSGIGRRRCGASIVKGHRTDPIVRSQASFGACYKGAGGRRGFLGSRERPDQSGHGNPARCHRFGWRLCLAAGRAGWKRIRDGLVRNRFTSNAYAPNGLTGWPRIR